MLRFSWTLMSFLRHTHGSTIPPLNCVILDDQRFAWQLDRRA